MNNSIENEIGIEERVRWALYKHKKVQVQENL